jgi:hypothetical protein
MIDKFYEFFEKTSCYKGTKAQGQTVLNLCLCALVASSLILYFITPKGKREIQKLSGLEAEERPEQSIKPK